MKKKILIGCGSAVLILIIAFVSLVVCFFSELDDSLSKEEIFNLVNDNYTIILEDIEEQDFLDTENIYGVQEVYSENEIIDVYCGGRGMGSATSYYGFYYSPDNQPKAVWCGSDFGENPNLRREKDGFCIKNSNDDNYYYTEKIRDKFYYYEAHF